MAGVIFGLFVGVFVASAIFAERKYVEQDIGQNEYQEQEHKMKEMVNHPSHYNIPGKKECIVEMEEKFGKEAVYYFCVLNAFKYRYRAGEKEGNSYEQDENKAKWYETYAEKMKG